MRKTSILSAIAVVALGIFIYQSQQPKKPSQTLGESTEIQQIKIGALLPLTGSFSNLGEDIRNAIELGREDLKRRFNLDIEVVYEDSAADPKVAVPAAVKLIELDRVPIILGGPGSSGNLAAAPLMQKSQTLFLPISSTPKLNEAGDYIFKLHPDIEHEARLMANYIHTLNLKTACMVYDLASDTQTIAQQVFAAEFASLGGKVFLSQGYDSKTTTDFRTILTKFKDTECKALYFYAVEKVAGNIVKQAREIGLTQPLFGWSAYNSDEFFRLAGKYAEGVIITDQPFSCSGNLEMRHYCFEYANKYPGRTPLQYGARIYDAMDILARLLIQHSLDKEKIKYGLFNIANYEGASGHLKFDAKGKVREVNLVFRIAKDGKFVGLE